MTKYHFIGIKGSGMSALAQILHDLGYKVQGSDVETTYFTQQPLEEKGIPILPFHRRNIESDMCVIAGNAFTDEHPEIKECLERNISLYRYHHFLGEFIKGFTSIAVTGSHGKTSTTGLLAHVLGSMAPTSYLIGDGTGKGMPQSDYFVFEACEYRRHFLAYEADYAIITNIDFDHPDYFSGIDDVILAFEQFANQTKRTIVACGDDPHVRRLNTSTPILYYGFSKQNDLQAKNVTTDVTGVSFDVYFYEEKVERFTIPLYGEHNILNALSVIGLCLLEGVSLDLLKEYLSTFKGVKRRFTEKKVKDNILIDDYAHHPTEIRATVAAVRAKYPDKRLISIFQPHTYSRTKRFLHEFADSLSLADEVYLCDIFASARETQSELNIYHLLDKIPQAKLIDEKSVAQLTQYHNAILLFMGAGDIQKIQRAFEEMVS